MMQWSLSSNGPTLVDSGSIDPSELTRMSDVLLRPKGDDLTGHDVEVVSLDFASPSGSFTLAFPQDFFEPLIQCMFYFRLFNSRHGHKHITRRDASSRVTFQIFNGRQRGSQVRRRRRE